MVYTNTPPAGAFRGYGAMQCQFGIEVLMAEIAEKLGLDVVEFKRNNWIKLGEEMYLSKALGEGREGTEQSLQTSGIGTMRGDRSARHRFLCQTRRLIANKPDTCGAGIGMSVMIHGSGIAGLDMAAATLKMNDDGSFNLLIGATDLGTGSDTILAQMAAEVLGIPLEDVIVYSSDTDFTPFDKGAYASSTTYISGGAVRKAALQVKEQILEHAARMLSILEPDSLRLRRSQGDRPGWSLCDPGGGGAEQPAPDGTSTRSWPPPRIPARSARRRPPPSSPRWSWTPKAARSRSSGC